MTVLFFVLFLELFIKFINLNSNPVHYILIKHLVSLLSVWVGGAMWVCECVVSQVHSVQCLVEVDFRRYISFLIWPTSARFGNHVLLAHASNERRLSRDFLLCYTFFVVVLCVYSCVLLAVRDNNRFVFWVGCNLLQTHVFCAIRYARKRAANTVPIKC